jgi:hypothetical protein
MVWVGGSEEKRRKAERDELGLERDAEEFFFFM